MPDGRTGNPTRPVAGRGQLKRLLFLAGAVLLLSHVAVAQESAAAESVPATSEADTSDVFDESLITIGEGVPGAESSGSVFGFWQLLQMVLVLGAVVGVIYLIFYFLKKAGTGRFAKSDAIRVLGSQTLPGNRALYLVEVGSQVFMIGSGSESVNLIAEITDRETVDSLILDAGEQGHGSGRSFGELIGGLLKGGQAQTLDLMRNQRSRLQKLRQ